MSDQLSLRLRLRDVIRGLWREVAKFGVVGAVAFVVDAGGFNLLVFGLPGVGDGPMASMPVLASVVATAAAMVVGWIGNRHWTYRDQRSETSSREVVVFVLVNLAGIVITAAPVYLSRAMGFDSALTDNITRLFGWAVATLVRFVVYRRYVFQAA
ncbi:GtrA family protein [Streptomyces sp. NBC_01353]|uniref:GtrA family protein n=1 Tax=Streptomyces sp. NBC_01353 TaxID=2903835 RepID=UPI002E3298D4|nr:GtrA family protein [Streptomyces sp. NBC_01353]